MNTVDPRFILQFSAPVAFREIEFAAARVEIIEQTPRVGLKPGTAAGYRFRAVRDSRAGDSTEPDPVWVAIGPEFFAPDASPSEGGAQAAIELMLAGPSDAEKLAAAKLVLIARATERRWEVEVGGVGVGGMTVATDDRSKTLLLQADREARENGLGTRWKGADGVWVPFTAAQVRGAAAAMSAHVRACFQHEEVLHDAINGAVDLAGLDALKPAVESFTL